MRRRRKALDLTQARLGERVGASAAMIRKIEANERLPSRQLAELLASVLGLAADERDLFLRAARNINAVEKLTISEKLTSNSQYLLHPPSNLPAPMTSMIDRLSDLAAVTRLILREDVRLITIIGPPGIGKTRLSIQVAEEVLPHFPDGVWFVDLSAITDPELVLPTIQMTLSLPPAGSLSPAQLFRTSLRDKKMLLVLDNLEQIVEQASLNVANLLRACKGVKVLATSRFRLDIYGEYEYALSPMSVPPPDRRYSKDELVNYEAVQLFIARARQHQPDFDLTVATAAAVAEICRRVDGLPLALELAAARLRKMSVQKLAEALSEVSGRDWLALFHSPSRDLPPRQQTLFNSVAWSYTLLEPGLQNMLQQLSVFAGTFDWPAVAAVVNVPSLPGGAAQREALEQLVDHNLVSLDSRSPERWRLLEMIREFARTELSPDLAQLVCQRHAQYFLTRLVALNAEPHKTTYLADFDLESADGRAALRFALEKGDAPLAHQLSFELGVYWELRGFLYEGRRFLEAVLALPGSVNDTLRTFNFHRAANLAWMQHDFKAAHAYASAGLDLARTGDDKLKTVELMNLQARILLEEGRYKDVDAVLTEAVQLERSLPEQVLTPFMLVQQGEAALALDDLSRAEALTRAGLAALSNHDIVPYCMGWTNLAEVALARGDSEAARSALRYILPVVHLHIRRMRIFLNAIAGLPLINGNHSEGDFGIAIRLLSYLSAANQYLGDPLPPFTQRQMAERLERARQKMPVNSWQAAMDEGAHWTDEEALYAAKRVLVERIEHPIS